MLCFSTKTVPTRAALFAVQFSLSTELISSWPSCCHRRQSLPFSARTERVPGHRQWVRAWRSSRIAGRHASRVPRRGRAGEGWTSCRPHRFRIYRWRRPRGGVSWSSRGELWLSGGGWNLRQARTWCRMYSRASLSWWPRRRGRKRSTREEYRSNTPLLAWTVARGLWSADSQSSPCPNECQRLKLMIKKKKEWN